MDSLSDPLKFDLKSDLKKGSIKEEKMEHTITYAFIRTRYSVVYTETQECLYVILVEINVTRI